MSSGEVVGPENSYSADAFGLIELLAADREQALLAVKAETARVLDETTRELLGEDWQGATRALFGIFYFIDGIMQAPDSQRIPLFRPFEFDETLEPQDCVAALAIASKGTGYSFAGRHRGEMLVAVSSMTPEDALRNWYCEATTTPEEAPPKDPLQDMFELVEAIYHDDNRRRGEVWGANRRLIGQVDITYLGAQSEGIALLLNELLPQISQQAELNAAKRFDEITPIETPKGVSVGFLAKALKVAALAKQCTYIGSHNDVPLIIGPNTSIQTAIIQWFNSHNQPES
jgi:hypothetical protein